MVSRDLNLGLQILVRHSNNFHNTEISRKQNARSAVWRLRFCATCFEIGSYPSPNQPFWKMTISSRQGQIQVCPVSYFDQHGKLFVQPTFHPPHLIPSFPIGCFKYFLSQGSLYYCLLPAKTNFALCPGGSPWSDALSPQLDWTKEQCFEHGSVIYA